MDNIIIGKFAYCQYEKPTPFLQTYISRLISGIRTKWQYRNCPHLFVSEVRTSVFNLRQCNSNVSAFHPIDVMRSLYTTVALIPIYLATSVLAGVKEIWWNITYVEGANPDGLFERRVVGVNNTWPYVVLFQLVIAEIIIYTLSLSRPPPIEVESTDKLLLHVTNSLDQPTTLHHHGMFFTQNSWMDGTRQVSQW
jgi:hypothetical protein